MRVCIDKSTGLLLESQSDGEGKKDLDVLIANAVAMGYQADAVEAKYVEPAEFAQVLAEAQAPAIARQDLEAMRSAALRVLDEVCLEAAARDPNAPPEVKAYADALANAMSGGKKNG